MLNVQQHRWQAQGRRNKAMRRMQRKQSAWPNRQPGASKGAPWA